MNFDDVGIIRVDLGLHTGVHNYYAIDVINEICWVRDFRAAELLTDVQCKKLIERYKK